MAIFCCCDVLSDTCTKRKTNYQASSPSSKRGHKYGVAQAASICCKQLTRNKQGSKKETETEKEKNYSQTQPQEPTSMNWSMILSAYSNRSSDDGAGSSSFCQSGKSTHTCRQKIITSMMATGTQPSQREQRAKRENALADNAETQCAQ